MDETLTDSVIDTRKQELTEALEQEGLRYRDDSVFCQQYLKHGPKGQFRGFTLDISIIVTQLSQAKWFHEYTYYRMLMASLKEDGYNWSDACRIAKRRILDEHHGFPKVWPWKLPVSDTADLELVGLHTPTPYTRLWADIYHARHIIERWLYFHFDHLTEFLHNTVSESLSHLVIWTLAIIQSVSRYRHVTFMVSDVGITTDRYRSLINDLLANISHIGRTSVSYISCHRIINEHGCCVGLCVKRQQKYR